MKLHLPLSLRSALLACLAFCPAAYADTYVATGVNAEDITTSDRFYDTGQGYYWLEADAQPFLGAGYLYEFTGSTEFLGSLNSYIPAGTDTSHVHSGLFSGLTNDSKTTWLSATANVIQYWQSYYGVFSQKAAEMPYGYTYDPANQSTLGGTQSLNLGMYFYDNWTNAGGDFAMAARWYLTNDHTYTDKGDMGISELKKPGSAAGYFTPYFESGEASVLVMEAPTQEKLDAAIVKAFGLSAVEGQENTYTQTTPGQIAFLGISSGEASTALTCYGFKTDAAGNVTSLMLAASDDAAYQLTELFVKEENGKMRLYTDASCTRLWERGGETNWYVDAVSCINTPETLVNLYNEYTASDLTWTGNSSIWKQEADNKTLSILPDATSGWTAHAGTDTEFAGEYAAYFTEGRNVLFTSTGAGAIELVGNIEPSRITVNNDLGADYTFTGEGKLTGITRLTKQGEGALTISTANDYSGGTFLDGGTIVADNTMALGTGKINISNGVLDFNGNELKNSICIIDEAVVTLQNGVAQGNMEAVGVKTLTVSDFRVRGEEIKISGDGKTSWAYFCNLDRNYDGTQAYRGGYLSATNITIADMNELRYEDSRFTHSGTGALYGALAGGDYINIKGNGNIYVVGNQAQASTGEVLGGMIYSWAEMKIDGNAGIVMRGNEVKGSGNVYGGLLYAPDVQYIYYDDGTVRIQPAQPLAVENNASIELLDNKTDAGGEGRGGVFRARGINLIGNVNVLIDNNELIANKGAYGGAIWGTVMMMNNESVTLSCNSVQSGKAASGGAISGGANISENSLIEFSHNTATSKQQTANGGAINGNLTLHKNNQVIFEENIVDARLGAKGGAICGTVDITENPRIELYGNKAISSAAEAYGGAIYSEESEWNSNDEIVIKDNNVHGYTLAQGGAIFGDVKMTGNTNVLIIGNCSTSTAENSSGGAISGRLTMIDNQSVKISDNIVSALKTASGGAVGGGYTTISGSGLLEVNGNYAKSSSEAASGGAFMGASLTDNDKVNLIDNHVIASGIAYGGAINGSVTLQDNGNVSIARNSAESMNAQSYGGAIYYGWDISVMNNAQVLLRGNYERQADDYRLRSIYAGANLELQANAGQEIKVYDSVYAGGNLVLNANGAGGSILLSGEYTEADLLAAKGGAGTTQEITNSRTNTVVGTTTLGGGVLRLEHGAILQTGGFSTVTDSDAQVWLDNAVLNSSGYDATFGGGTGLVVGGSNTLTASNFTMQDGSYLSFDLRDKNRNLSALSVNANMELNGLDVVVMNADIMAAGKYKLLSLAEGAQYDTGSWTQSINSVTGADASTLSWENGTLYYTSTNSWIVSVTENASILEDKEGKDIVIGNGAMVEIDASVEVPTCRQGHPYCDNPKHGGRPGNPGQGHAKPKPGNSGNNNGSTGQGGSASLVIVEGSAYIKDRGAFEGLLSFRGSADEERHFYTDKDLGVAYIAVFTDEDATSHLHIVEGKKVAAVGIVGDGNLEIHGAGCLVLEGHDADESSTEYFGCLGVEEGAVRVADNSQAYLAHTEVNGDNDHHAGMEVGHGASMTGESLHVRGEHGVLHNDGCIAMTEGITVDGGTVKGSGTFSNLTMNGGRLVVGNSPGMQSYDGDLILGDDSELLFSVAGFENYATEGMSGWGADVYSTIDMGGNEFSISGEAGIILAFGADALTSLSESTTAHPLTFEMTLLQNVGNIATLDSATLSALVGITTFCITEEAEGLPGWAMSLSGSDLTNYVSGVSYSIAGSNIVISGSIATNGAFAVPEPATATLSLLALVGLVAHRRRKA